MLAPLQNDHLLASVQGLLLGPLIGPPALAALVRAIEGSVATSEA